VTLNASANFEVKPSYAINVVATDAAGLTSTQAVAVTVTNVNEAPVVTSGATATVVENAAISTVVYTATATDVDAGDTLAYSLTGTDAAAFDINATTGVVTLKASADFETKAAYAINVVATDAGGLTNSKAVAVDVTNVAGTAFLLTTGIDTGAAFVGGAEPDTFTGNDAAGVMALTSLDSIDGGAGTDTLNITALLAINTTTPVGYAVSSIENVNLVSAATVTADTTATNWSGVTNLTTSSIGNSTPRSPRATMIPSNAATISTKFGTA
jgi:hypothetical protein